MAALEADPSPPAQVVRVSTHLFVHSGAKIPHAQEPCAPPLYHLLLVLISVVGEPMEMVGKARGGSLLPAVLKWNVRPVAAYIIDHDKVRLRGF